VSGQECTEDRRVIACNYIEGTNVAALGAKAYVIPQLGGNLPERVRILARSRGGRWVEKWESVRRLSHFRIVTLPPEHPRYADARLWDCEVGESDVRRLEWAREEMAGR